VEKAICHQANQRIGSQYKSSILKPYEHHIRRPPRLASSIILSPFFGDPRTSNSDTRHCKRTQLMLGTQISSHHPGGPAYPSAAAAAVPNRTSPRSRGDQIFVLHQQAKILPLSVQYLLISMKLPSTLVASIQEQLDSCLSLYRGFWTILPHISIISSTFLMGEASPQSPPIRAEQHIESM